ncbi:MAG TPA: DUF1015 domain-containing protein [Polyangia bacterium]|nr:DUF1015 domain-containing protein [Polyangia bacterium]
MAVIAPFRGLRYDLTRVGDPARVLAPPYDVISEAQHQELEARHPHNVVRLERPRGDGDARYGRAAALLDSWIAEGILIRDQRPALYVYQQTFRFPADGGAVYNRTGFFALVKLEPFSSRVVLPHEHTLSAPKEDRRKLMRTTRTQISQVFGLYRDRQAESEELLVAARAAPALLDGTTADGCRHRLWAVTDPRAIARMAEVLRDKQILIADGHHRYETMVGLRDELRPAGRAPGHSGADWGAIFLARAEDPGLLVLPTHRLITHLPSWNPEALRAGAAAAFEVARDDERDGAAIEARLTRAGAAGRVAFAVRAAGERQTTWLTLKRDADLSELGPPALRQLDVSVLHGLVLAPLLGIDAGAMVRQSYLGYTHDTAQALADVGSGQVQGAFLMNATKVEQVLQACEAGFVLPQKSTYFQPKLATGLVMYQVDPDADVASG